MSQPYRTGAMACLLALVAAAAIAAPARLVRYPHAHNSRIVFTYLGDIWTATDTGQDVRRITVNKARDVYPRFSPDGKWIAFSSDRNGNLDVYVVPTEGGQPTQLTFHSADDAVVGWTPDSSAVLFSSSRGEDFMPKLYTVSVRGGLEQGAGPDMGLWASYSPDGTRLALNRKGQVYWRKYYRGAMQTDITIMDVAKKTFRDATDFDGLDSWPMWAHDGFIYFVSDREGNGLTNIWRIPENGGAAEQVTKFTSGDVRWPSISSDGKTIMFEHEFGAWKLDVASKRAAAVPLDIAAETEENTSQMRDFTSEADDYDLAPSAKRVAFSIHGEVFTAPVEQGDLVQVTNGPARDQQPQYSPDGKSIAYVSDRSGREEIYVAAADGSGEAKEVTDLDVLKLGYAWSPDSKRIAFAGSDLVLRVVDVTAPAAKPVEIAKSTYGQVAGPAWSPDGKWIAYSKTDETRQNDIYIVPSQGGEEKKATFDAYNDIAPRFSPDGKKLYFIRGEGFGGSSAGGPIASNIWSITLDKLTKDPDEPDENAPEPSSDRGEGTSAGRRAEAAPAAPADVSIDWSGLKRRTTQVTRLPFPITQFVISRDSKTLVFVAIEPSTRRNTPVVYSVQQDGKRQVRILAAQQGERDDEEPALGGFGRGLTDLRLSRDGRTLFFREASAIYSAAMPRTPEPGAPDAPGGPRGDAARRKLAFTAKVRVESPAEWTEMFDDAWRTMKYRFYDPQMHGKDWNAARDKYRPLVAYVADRQELLNVVNEMIGELNASHTGSAPPARREGAVSTGNLGIELVADEKAGRYRVTHVYEDGPADKDWVKVSQGDYLIAIGGTPVKAGDNYWRLLNYRLNRKIDVTFNSQPTEQGAWTTRIAPVPQSAYNQLRYERWVKERRQTVDKLSGGRIGYLHIQAMNEPSLRKFEKELRENRGKQALVIDQRWNGGGNIDQELLGILVQRNYQMWQPRGTEATARPFSGFFGPKVVLQNWRSASNAEMFPAGFRALGLGKVIGTPTMGAVIGTGSYTLIDGSTVRTPGVGVFLADSKKTNMENYGVQPDIRIENTPEDNLAGRDRQLEAAVNELLKEIGATTKKTTN